MRTTRRALEPYTPEHVAKISGLSVEQITLLADLFGRRDLKITSLWCMGMNQHTQGTAINNLVHGIHLLSGHFGKPGDAPTSLTGQPSACGTVREVGTLAHALPGGRVVANDAHRAQTEGFWNLPSGRVNKIPGYHTVKMWERFCTPTDKGGDIGTIWVQVTNPGQTLPNLHKLFNAKKGLEDKFLIVSEVYPTATTALADLVLPSAMWVEKNGMFGNSERRTQQWFKMVEPPGDARDDVWQTVAVAHRLMALGHPGMKDKDGRFIFETKNDAGEVVETWKWPHYYDVNVDKILFQEYRQFTRLKHKDLAPYDEYVKTRGMRWPVVEQSDGSWRETRFRFSEFDDPYVKKGSEIDFYHSTSKDGRAQIWFRPYVPPPEMPDKDYPLWLCTGRVLEHWHTGTMTMRIPQLRRSMPGAYVELHPDDARALGVASGQRVRVETRRGKIELTAWIGGRGAPNPGNIFVPFFDETKLINMLTLDAHDPFSKQPDYKKCAARVRAAASQRGTRAMISEPGRRVMMVGAVLAITIAFVASAVQIFHGTAQDTERAQGWKPPQAAVQPAPEGVGPALTYRELRSERRGPNAGWKSSIAALRTPPAPEVLEGRSERKTETLVRRRTLRAFDGAPPTIPHAVRSTNADDCLACHADGIVLDGRRATPISHPPYANCQQCHAAGHQCGCPAVQLRSRQHLRGRAGRQPGWGKGVAGRTAGHSPSHLHARDLRELPWVDGASRPTDDPPGEAELHPMPRHPSPSGPASRRRGCGLWNGRAMKRSISRRGLFRLFQRPRASPTRHRSTGDGRPLPALHRRRRGGWPCPSCAHPAPLQKKPFSPRARSAETVRGPARTGS